MDVVVSMPNCARISISDALPAVLPKTLNLCVDLLSIIHMIINKIP